jgi:GAF domain-containing protein
VLGVPVPFEGDRHSGSVLERARRIVATAEADDGLEGTAALLQRVCRGLAEALSVDGCAVHVLTGNGASDVVAASDPGSARIADVAFTTGEGPSLDAFATRRAVLVPDLRGREDRWSGFTQAATEAGVAGVFSLPVVVGPVVLGILELYVVEPRRLTDDDLALADACCQLAAQAVLGHQTVRDDGAWEPLLDHRAEIHQAQGMVMVDLKVDLEEALLRMRAHAFTDGIALIDLARAIIAGVALPEAAAEEA